MPYDFFISYAHDDNTANAGWVHRFCDKLIARYRAQTGKKPDIFLDRDGLNTGNVLSDRLQNALNESRIFIPVLSPTYLSSRWCRREFLHFFQQAGEGLIVNGSSRIVPVRLMAYDRYDPDADTAAEVARITGFFEQQEILYADFFQDPLPLDPDDRAFDLALARLAGDLYELLKQVQQRPQSAADTADAAPGIFLGYTAADAKNLRDGLLTELRQQRKYNKIPHRTLPDDAPDAPADPKALSAAAVEDLSRRCLQASACSIHLFGDLEGPKAADTGEPLARIQYRLAKERASTDPAFRVFAALAQSDECSADREQFLRSVEADARANDRVEILPAFEVKAIKDYLLDHLRLQAEREALAAQHAPAVSGANEALRRVFFIHDHRDKNDPFRDRLDDLLYDQRYEVYVPVFREDEPNIDPDAAFRNFWLVSNTAVILLRNASSAWCNAMKVELIKTATEKKPPYRMAICVTDPDAGRRIREVRSHEFRVIDCAQEGFEQQLVQFLTAPSHA